MFHSRRVTYVLAAFLLIVILQSSTILWAQDSGSTPTRTLGTPTGGYWTGPVSGALPDKISANALAKWGGNIGSLPTSFSWSGWDGLYTIGTNYMTPVRDQGGCGSCWAFASIGGMEAQYQINKGNPSTGIDLSEQNVLQCSGGSCSGWYMSSTLDFLKTSGTPDEGCNPYNAADHLCGTGRCSDYLSRTYKITGWSWISTDTATIKYNLYNHGPVMVWMPVFDDFPWWEPDFWRYYYYGHNTSGSYGGHFVVIVGWYGDESNGWWIARNSWGTGGGDTYYGQGGYFYMTMNPSNGFFGIYQEAAVISDVTPPSPSSPVLLSPADWEVVGSLTPTLSWQSSSGATDYGVSVYVQGGSLVVSQMVSDISFVVPGGLLVNGQSYVWLVSAHNSGGFSAPSGRAFRTPSVAPSSPVLLSPADWEVVGSLTPTLSWQSSSGATDYVVRIYTWSGSTVVTQVVTGTSFTVGSGLLSNGQTYTWMVWSHNSAGYSSPSGRAFRT